MFFLLVVLRYMLTLLACTHRDVNMFWGMSCAYCIMSCQISQSLDFTGFRLENRAKIANLVPTKSKPKENQPPEHWRGAALATAKKFSRQSTASKLVDLYESVLVEYEGPRDIPEAWFDMLGAEAFATRLKAEWDLISGKTSAMVKAWEAK